MNVKKKKLAVLVLSFALAVFIVSRLQDKVEWNTLLKRNVEILDANSTRSSYYLDWIMSFVRNISDDQPESYLLTSSNSSMRKIKLLLFIGIHSAPSRIERRNAIRDTWMTECGNNLNVVCKFFTDGRDSNGHALDESKRSKLENESSIYGDILLSEAPGGVNFATKYLSMLQWASKRYNFQYFLRLDDDYFICLHRLIHELESNRPKENFQWGWLHCERKGMREKAIQTCTTIYNRVQKCFVNHFHAPPLFSPVLRNVDYFDSTTL